ncbi:Formyltetrahydrofolate deformylase [Nymphon striatum]|nr:Formyltetrahydrofolate deformylase [Nymphon striatum]
MRVESDFEASTFSIASFKKEFENDLALPYKMKWSFNTDDMIPKMALFVSKYNHCLYDLLSRYKSGELKVDIPFIVSNHSDLKDIADQFDIPFYHIPVTKETKAIAEDKQLILLKENQIDFIVLARYMQIVSSKIIDQYTNRIINIHHSFLPAFAGAKPYHAAFKRGVKIIGATSHYVTEALDAGPIIEQDVTTVSHSHAIKDFIAKGRDLEKILQQVINQLPQETSGISNLDIASGLREALDMGIDKQVTKLTTENGFFKNELVKILLPEELQKVDKTLRDVGLGNLADEGLRVLNRAAEDAVGEATPIFINAVKGITFSDAKSILLGNDDAATHPIADYSDVSSDVAKKSSYNLSENNADLNVYSDFMFITDSEDFKTLPDDLKPEFNLLSFIYLYVALIGFYIAVMVNLNKKTDLIARVLISASENLNGADSQYITLIVALKLISLIAYGYFIRKVYLKSKTKNNLSPTSRLINTYRIQEAKELLNNDKRKNLNIIDIAYEVGYNNKVTFNKAFKKDTKLTPSQYQRNVVEA